MTTGHPISQDVVPRTWVAIDIAEDAHAVLIEQEGRRERFRLSNMLEDIENVPMRSTPNSQEPSTFDEGTAPSTP